MRAGSKKNRKRQKSAQGEFRIIAGEWRSRRLSFPEVEGLRPTTDRVRETVFNWINVQLPSARVLDLFAGSGALGFEALSRGASTTTFIEKNKVAYDSLISNIELLNAEADVVNGDALDWLTKSAAQYDLVFLDPPFRKGLLDDVLSRLKDSSILKEDALIYLEHEKESPPSSVPSSWTLLKEKEAGQVSYRLYQA